MIATLPLKEMNLSEKFMTIEMIWDDIIHNSANFPSPEWHADVLKERDAKIKSGEDKLIDWNLAKKQLRDSI
jgi:Putative addiction module component